MRASTRRTVMCPIAATFAIALLLGPAAQMSRASAETLPSARTEGSERATPSEFVLGNGVRVVVIPDHRVPVVTHMVWYAVGARDEAEDQHGVAHYLEHMMFKGTARYPKGEFDRFVMRRGGMHNAATNMDSTYYYQRLPKSALPTIMAMEADRMVSLRIEEADVASERTVVLEEYRRGETGITSEIDKAKRGWLYGGNPRGRSVIGTEAEIRALSGRSAQRFYEQYYGPERATVVLAGDVTEAEARALADATYGKVTPRPELLARHETPLPQPGQSHRIVMSHERATAVSVTRTYLFDGLDRLSRREVNAANVFAYIAGGGLTSRIHRRLVNEAAVATGAGCQLSVLRTSSEFSCGASGNVGVAAATLETAFDAALVELAGGAVTEAEFDEVKSRFIATAAYRKDNVFARASSYAASLAHGQSIADVDALEADVSSLTRAEVEAIGKTILTRARHVTGILTPRLSVTADTQPPVTHR